MLGRDIAMWLPAAASKRNQRVLALFHVLPLCEIGEGASPSHRVPSGYGPTFSAERQLSFSTTTSLNDWGQPGWQKAPGGYGGGDGGGVGGGGDGCGGGGGRGGSVLAPQYANGTVAQLQPGSGSL